ncbi:MAG: ribbon-helix-helix domain-containing protein [Thermodesulfobacteriota bacterium]
MAKAKIAITVDEETLNRIDRLVCKRAFPNRSRAIQAAVEEKLGRMERTRLARECANLDPAQEQALAEEGLTKELDRALDGLYEIIGTQPKPKGDKPRQTIGRRL